jgi:ABC transporter substrate binding protein
MRRRDFIGLLGGAATWPLAARAQPSDRVRWLAAMMGGRNADTDPDGRAWFLAFRQGLQDLGWVEGRNFRADYRWPAGDLDRMRVIAREFVDLQPDVLVASNTPAVVSLLRETRTIPIVFTLLSDPVGTGVVASLARPGGNATGFTAFEYSLAGKWLEILKDIAPAVREWRCCSIRRPLLTPSTI